MLIKRCFAVKDGVSVVSGVGKFVGEGIWEETGVTAGIVVGVGDSEETGVGVVSAGVATSSLATFALTVALILGLGSTVAGATVEQPSKRVPVSRVRTTLSFILETP